MTLWTKSVLKPLVFPGGVLLLMAVAFVSSHPVVLTLSSVTLVFFSIIGLGLLLSWRFHSSRVFFSLITLMLAQQAITQFSSGRIPLPPAGHVAVLALSVIVPLNFVMLAFIRERGFTSDALTPLAITLFVESVIVTVLCRGAQNTPIPKHHGPVVANVLPAYAWAAFAICAAILLARFVMAHKPVEIGFFWSLCGFLLALHSGGNSPAAMAYFGVAALILTSSIIETSYMLAYHDELTTLPSRRAFNDALLRLQVPYTIAVVDIDHFKKFNDTYGHDTGDEVLRLVASKLARVTGGGDAFRCGGEEFNILFPGKTTSEVVEHLERLRAAVESANFRLRGHDRRKEPRGPDRRKPGNKRDSKNRPSPQLEIQFPSNQFLSVTVSIGVASSTGENSNPEQVIKAADTALYRAKDAGRNRVEVAAAPRRRPRAKSAGIA